MGDDELLVDDDTEGDPLTLSRKDAVMQLEDVCDSVEDTLGELEEDPDELRETESVWVIVGDNELLVDEDSERDPLTLSLKDAVIQLEDV